MAPPVGTIDDDSENNREGSRRSRRDRKGASKAQKALEKIRKYRETGERTSYEVEEAADLYEVVDEKQYAKIVRQRQEEDWIVDDDGSGYVEDGREIFDDDLTEEVQDVQKKKKEKQSASKPKINSNKITNLFMAKTKKKKEEDVSLNNDDVLDDILQSIQTSGPLESMDRKTASRKTPKRSTGNSRVPRRLQTVDAELHQSKPVIKLKTHRAETTFKKPNKSPVKVKQEKVESEAMELENDSNFYDNDYSNDLDIQDDTEPTAVQSIHKQPKDEAIDDFDENIDMGDEIDVDEIEGEEKKQAREEETDESQDSGIHCTWEEILQKSQVDDDKEIYANVSVDSSSLLLTEVDGEKVLRMFWLDAYEDSYHQPGTVYLFGKVYLETAEAHVSCCVTVKNIDKRLLLLPRKFKLDKNGKETEQEVTMKDVYEEFNNIASKMKIMSFKCKPCKMKYSFDLADVPSESDYLEIVYSADQPQLPKDLHGNTFTRVFGTNTSSLELLLVSRKLKGPSWIHIKYPQVPKQNVSWCKIEALVSKPEFIEVVNEQAPAPPLTVLSLAIRTIRNSKTRAHEVLGVTGLVQTEFCLDKAAPKNPFNHCFSFITKPTEHILPYDFQTVIKNEKRQIQVLTSERALLGLLLAHLQLVDPDVIVGHDVIGFDFDVLLHRISANKVPHWSKIGRLKRQSMPKLSGSHASKGAHFGDKNTSCGRLVCDTKISAKELIRCKSYDLTELSRVVLNNIREEVDVDDVPVKMRKSKELVHLLDITTMDALYSLKIVYELSALPLAYQITGICGNVLSRTLQGGRSERNEFLLLHAFAKEGYICPDKTYSKKPEVHFHEDEEGHEPQKGKTRKKPQYAGGLVLEPKKGFYDKFILLLDFNSLYPSIIQEFNICFTTVNRQFTKEDESEIPELPDSDLPPGILPTEIRKLVERRKQVKGMMKSVAKDAEMYLQYDIRQKALKLTANSMYGCLGFSHSRFYAKPLAAMVTMKGREILMKTKDLVQALNLDVIYGDTDSIMINTNSIDFDEVYKIGNRVKNEVNKLYKMLEIDIDGIFKSMLLLKKKKYAAVAIQKLANGEIVQTRELKGLDIVRRDWCDLAKEAGIFVVNQILSCKPCDVIVESIHDHLIKLRGKIDSDTIATRKFQIAKGLAKAPEEYPDKKSLPHVTVAQRLMSQGKRVAVGDTISYIICDDGSNLPATHRAYHPDEFLKSSNLKIDYKYYLANQVHPVVSRMIDPIEGTNPALIAECLGLDPSNYSSRTTYQAPDSDPNLGIKVFLSDEERFNDVEKFKVCCKNQSCKIYKEEVEFEGSFAKDKNPWVCPACKENYNANFILNSLTLFIRQKINLYYQGWVACDDATCAKQTKLIRLTGSYDGQLCYDCKTGHLRVVYSDAQLYNQLFYLQKLFSGKTEPSGLHRGTSENSKFAQKMDKLMAKNGFSTIP